MQSFSGVFIPNNGIMLIVLKYSVVSLTLTLDQKFSYKKHKIRDTAPLYRLEIRGCHDMRWRKAPNKVWVR